MTASAAASGAGAAVPAGPTPFAPEQEVRFAVVMYGGVSLAIYINGVAQELLNLVRATAPAAPAHLGATEALYTDDELEGTTAAVYRELGRLLRRHGGAATAAKGSPIHTRFVVDVISGTSAGGLNGIYLAKALANDQPIDGLKQLWVDEADVAKIVNDDESYDRLGIKRHKPPESALNSRRMYWKLLDALDRMDRARPARKESPLVDELDLWITTTDVRGLTVPIDLYDRFVFERRHRKVFHFVYGSSYARGALEPTPPRNDFRRRNNPFLAFAGRCTSAFPFAFEPMQLDDIDEVVGSERFRDEYGDRKSGNADWRRFFEEYLKPGGGETVNEAAESGDDIYRKQSFADGGYLDNKPFTWATRTLGVRRADLPVDRRLIYIEPDPGDAVLPHVAGEEGDAVAAWLARGPLAHIDPQKAGVRPNAIENVIAALTGIPRTEPIRDDLADIVRRNRELDRLDEITAIVDEPASRARLEHPDEEEIDLAVWRAESVADVIARRGIQYGGYHRLKVAAVADDLAAIVTRLAGFDEESDEYSAIRCFVQAWIQRHHPEDGTGQASQNEFLLRYDLDYRVRRTQFLLRQVDRLTAADPGLELVQVRRSLNIVLTRMRAFARALRARTPENPIRQRVAEIGFERWHLREILNGARTKRESVERAADVLTAGPIDGRVTAVADAVAFALSDAFVEARTDLLAAIDQVQAAEARAALRHAFHRYEVYDSVLFPPSYGHVSESDRVEVIRISPQDATSIMDETLASESRRKLAGGAIHHFGGFFDRAWRRNDILWGRLDAAERIITLLAPREQWAYLLERAQLAIVAEEFTFEGREELQAALVQTLLRAGEGGGVTVDRETLEAAVAGAQQPHEILEFLKNGYEVDRRLDPPSTLTTVGRMTAVTGEVLDGIVGSGTLKKPLRWLVRLGRLVWGLGEVTTPRSFLGLLWRWWSQLLALAAILMIVIGAAVGFPGAAKAGWIVLAAVVALKITTWVAEDLTSSGPARRRIPRAIVTLAILVMAAATAWAAYTLYTAADEEVDQAVCDLPGWLEEPAQTVWPFDDDRCGKAATAPPTPAD